MIEGHIPSPWEISDITLPDKPLLAPWVQVFELGDNRIQVRGKSLFYTFSHELFVNTFRMVLKLLDGKNDLNTIQSCGNEDIRPTTINYVLKILFSFGFLKEGNLNETYSFSRQKQKDIQAQIEFWSHYFSDGRYPLSVFSKTRVGLIGNDGILQSIETAFRKTGFDNITILSTAGLKTDSEEVYHKIEEIDFLIALQSFQDNEFFELINEICLKTFTRWMHIQIDGPKATLGPTIVPHQSACFKCYERRLASNIKDLESHEVFLKSMKRIQKPSDKDSISPLLSIVANQAVLELARILTSFAPPQTINCMNEINSTDLKIEKHLVYRVPRCEACKPALPDHVAWSL